MKAFVLVRGESGRLYLYSRDAWEYLEKGNSPNTPEFKFITDNDDYEVLKLMQALVNKDIEIKG